MKFYLTVLLVMTLVLSFKLASCRYNSYSQSSQQTTYNGFGQKMTKTETIQQRGPYGQTVKQTIVTRNQQPYLGWNMKIRNVSNKTEIEFGSKQTSLRYLLKIGFQSNYRRARRSLHEKMRIAAQAIKIWEDFWRLLYSAIGKLIDQEPFALVKVIELVLSCFDIWEVL